MMRNINRDKFNSLISNGMKKFLVVLGLLAVVPNGAMAASCKSLGGDCFVSCNDSKAGSGQLLSAGASGCADPTITGKNCCAVGSANQPAGAIKIIPKANGGGCKIGDTQLSASECGNYTVDDFVRLGINITDWILSIVGSLVIAMFVYGGFRMVVSRGDSKNVQAGKDAIQAAVIGTVIIFSSYVVIRFFMSAMGFEWQGTSGPLKLLPQNTPASSPATSPSAVVGYSELYVTCSQAATAMRNEIPPDCESAEASAEPCATLNANYWKKHAECEALR